MKEFRWEKAAQFNFPFEAAALNFIVTFFREHIQCIKSLCFKIPGVYKIILVMRAVFNFVRHPLLGVLPSAWVLFFFFAILWCHSAAHLGVWSRTSCPAVCSALQFFEREGKRQLLDLYFICRKKLHWNWYFLVNVYADWIFVFSNIFLWLKALILNIRFLKNWKNLGDLFCDRIRTVLLRRINVK